ncbi:hypothetical protein K7472_09095 [Streptomyces sp. PTM05]|uniref:Uncharacterized protein n=1 Tax=Streptantibioticus parmotrematis TaxID=2873249 RepID=A0ABS7QT77_9ACTN|nr:hypothetical protein [Streptantibioticus parmotrematis]MBY8884999.1 hypothetical protein [Streptantibioticus parmotrematis]
MDGLYVVRHEPTWREEPEPDCYDNGTDEKTAYALFGLAVYRANCLEHSLVNILAAAKLITAREQGEQLIRDPWTQGFKNMMGKLIKRAEVHTGAHPEVVADLARSLERRNFLVHHFWRERIQDMATEAGRVRMCADLKADCRLLTQADEQLSEKIVTPILERLGVTAAAIQAQYAEERRKAMERN